MSDPEGPREPESGFIDATDLALTPAEHERLKTLVHGPRLKDVAYSDRRYLVTGAGGDTGATARRALVYEALDDRRNAIAFQLEEFELTPEELALWAAAFEILCEQATHIVAVIEDYEGGYVWELGYLFRTELREKVWVLKRDYGSAGANRERYDNGMAASHVRLLENADRTVRWSDEAELRDGTQAIP